MGATMTNTWLRLWHDMPTDPKFRVIAKKSGRPLSEVLSVFVLMLTNASANDAARGALANWSDEDTAAALDIDADAVTAIREAMQGKTLNGDKLSGWAKRQPKREDNSADRVKAFRERSKQPVTQCNAEKRTETLDTEERREEERREDIQPTNDARAREKSGGMDGGDLAECKKAFNGSTERMLVEVEAAMGGNARKNAETWLANLLQTHGEDAVREGFQHLLTAKGEDATIVHPLRYWDAAAKNAKRQPARAAEKVNATIARTAAFRAILQAGSQP